MSTPEVAAVYREAFHQGLHDLGYRDGVNITLIVRYAFGDSRRIPPMVEELVAESVDVMVLIPAAVSIARTKAPATPIVTPAFYDPVAEGLVSSLARPGGNVTGLSWQSTESSAKRVELATEIVPNLRRMAIVFADNDRGSVAAANVTEQAARRRGIHVRSLAFRDHRSLEEVLSLLLRERPEFMIVVAGPLSNTYHMRLVSFATKARIPLISEDKLWAEAGAVLAYGPDGIAILMRAATYVDRILNGAKAGDLPIEQPSKWLLIVNRAAADAMGLAIPESILLRADEIIR